MTGDICRHTGAAALALAVVLRGAAGLGPRFFQADRLWGLRETPARSVPAQAAEAVLEPAAVGTDIYNVAPPPAEPQAEASPVPEAAEPEPIVFTEADAAAVGDIKNETGYAVDAAALLGRELGLAGRTVVIVHTHATEAYTPSPGEEYAASDTFRTLDTAYSVVGLGDRLAEQLAAAGIPVIHDRTIHDYPSYNEAYSRSGATVQGILGALDGPALVIDLHRDCVQLADGSWMATAEGERAGLMLVAGTDAGGLEHPLWEDGLALALQVQALGLREDGAVMRPVNLRTERFNQHLALSLLVEVGACGDTLPQARAAADALGRCLIRLLNAPSVSLVSG